MEIKKNGKPEKTQSMMLGESTSAKAVETMKDDEAMVSRQRCIVF